MNRNGLKPVLGHRPGRGDDRLLMVCYFDPNGISTVCENIAIWQQLSRFPIEIINLWPARRGEPLHLSTTLDLARYAGIIIHSTVSYSPVNLFSLDRQLERPFEAFDGLKILMKQDEQVLTNQLAEYIGKKKIDIVVTCVSPAELPKVYPRDVVGDVDFLHAFTGYISSSMRGLSRLSMPARSIDISYRGSLQPLEFGRLGYDKRGVGYDVAAATRGMPDLRVDISSRWEDRVNGTAWFDFLGQSKVVLGAESGSNLFDFTGEVAAWCRAYEKRGANVDRQSLEFYLGAHDEFLHRFEGNVRYATISPRHFEAATSHAAQVLYEGEYAGVFAPNRHFFPLKHDLSNIAEVLDFARDDRRLQEFADCAYEEIVRNPEYQYEHFVEKFDEAVERRGLPRRRRLSNPGRRDVEPNTGCVHKALVLMAHEPTRDPRMDWFSEGLAADYEVCEIGIHDRKAEANTPSLERLPGRRTRIRVDARRAQWDFVAPGFGVHRKASLGTEAMERLFVTGQLPLRSLGKAIGALDVADDDLNRFRASCDTFVKVNSALLDAARLTGGIDLIVAADLDTLPAGVALAEEYDVPLIYDAHDYWPYAFPPFRHWEIEFWSDLERLLLERATLPLTVSPQLADVMSEHYGHRFGCLPNCAPLGSERAIDLEAALAAHARREDVIFLVQGVFGPQRGYERLINVWDRVDPRAKLWLRGPDSPEKAAIIALAEEKGVLNLGVFFPDAVAEAELVAAARDADVGLVPYEPVSLNNRYCCPTKLSQYMAAGLPIICNELDFVKSLVLDNGLGTAVDFSDEAALVRAVNEFVLNRETIAGLSRKSQEFFRTSFNWQDQSRKTYAAIRDLMSARQPNKSAFDFGWIDTADHQRSEIDLTAQEMLKDEIQRASDVKAAEIDRLNTAYRAEINELSTEIVRLNDVYPAEIQRLHKIYLAEITRLQNDPVGVAKHYGKRRALELKAKAQALVRAGKD